jgi:Ca-activated chloride channel family protein
VRSYTYSRFVPELADALDLEALLESLADFLLRSGFAGSEFHYGWGEEEKEGTLDALRRAILEALLQSGQLTPEQLRALRGEGDAAGETALAELLDQVVQRLVERGYLDLESAAPLPLSHQAVEGRAGLAHAASREVRFRLSEKGVDFLAYRALRHILGSVGRSSIGAHETPYLATGVEADGPSKTYEFGDALNLDVNATLLHALARSGASVPLDLEYDDLMVRQAEYRSSCATVLLLDTSHSMILYGEDRFTPAKKVALALAHLIRTQYPGDTIRVVLFHDSAEEIPLPKLAHVQVGPFHTNTAEGLRLARRVLLAQRKDMRQIVMITDGKPSALTMPNGLVYKNAMGLDADIVAATLREVVECRRAGIAINTFMLARDRALVEFVKRVAALSRGKAYFTNTVTLGQFILMDFLRRRTRRIS